MSEILKIREKKAMEAIRDAYGTPAGEDGVTLFVDHHLEEIGQDYWMKHTGQEKPDPQKVLSLLVLKGNWDEDMAFDFTLPENITNYVICVRFYESNEIVEITMES